MEKNVKQQVIYLQHSGNLSLFYFIYFLNVRGLQRWTNSLQIAQKATCADYLSLRIPASSRLGLKAVCEFSGLLRAPLISSCFLPCRYQPTLNTATTPLHFRFLHPLPRYCLHFSLPVTAACGPTPRSSAKKTSI